MTRAFHSIVTWQKGPSGYMCQGFPLQKKSQFLHKRRPGVPSARGNFNVETLAFQQRADESEGPRRALLGLLALCQIIFGLIIWAKTRLFIGRRETTWSGEAICRLADNLCNHTAHVSPHLFIFRLAQCFRIMSEKDRNLSMGTKRVAFAAQCSWSNWFITQGLL